MQYVSTDQYQFAHGKSPRGFGSWGFFFDDARDASQVWFAEPAMTYAQAKRAAIVEAKRRDAVRIEVAS